MGLPGATTFLMSMIGRMMLGARTMARLLASIRFSVAISETEWSRFINTHKHWRERERERERESVRERECVRERVCVCV